MRTVINPLGFALLVAASPLGVGLLAQGMSIPTARLQSLVDSVRINAFYQLRAAADDQRHHPDRRPTTFLADSAKAQPELAAALIHLLERENARIATASAGSLSEDYLGVYYMDLTTTVGRIGDPTSAAALLGGMGGSGPADAALASFGDVAKHPTTPSESEFVARTPWRAWAFARAGAGSNAPVSVATSGAGALISLGGGVAASYDMYFAMARLAESEQIDGPGVRDQALLAGIRSRGEHLFVGGAAGFALATPVITSDAGSRSGPTRAALAYDLSAHAAFHGAGLALAVSGAVGPPRTSYVSVSLGAEFGWLGF